MTRKLGELSCSRGTAFFADVNGADRRTAEERIADVAELAPARGTAAPGRMRQKLKPDDRQQIIVRLFERFGVLHRFLDVARAHVGDRREQLGQRDVKSVSVEGRLWRGTDEGDPIAEHQNEAPPIHPVHHDAPPGARRTADTCRTTSAPTETTRNVGTRPRADPSADR
jgi:hypothetical protein